ncbi:MAG: DUF131 domain-containing protein [Aigarchaeota archaeon]|nr:DUF131 domain-containing protein [Aigarchaeota archaeon]
MPASHLVSLGLALILVGFAITFIALLLLSLFRERTGKAERRGGAVILIGPVPIVIGSDPEAAKTVIVLAIILLAAAAILFLALSVV